MAKLNAFSLAKSNETCDGSWPVANMLAKVESASMVLQRLEPAEWEGTYSSHALENEMRKDLNLTVDFIKLNLFSKGAQGKARPIDGSAFIKDKPQLQNVPLSALRPAIAHIKEHILSTCEADEHTYAAEYEDGKKLVFQDLTPLGSHIGLPISIDAVHTNHSERFLKMIGRVVERMVKLARSSGATFDINKLLPYMMDPDETNTGSPFFFSGCERTDEFRLATLTWLPPFDFHRPDPFWFDRLRDKLATSGMDPDLACASFLVYRKGAKYDAQWIYKPTAVGYVADYKVKGFSNAMRFAWGGSYGMYIVLTPAVVAMKLSRMATLGMYHTSELVAEYLPLMLSPFKINSDLSQFDRTQVKALQLRVIHEFKTHVPELSVYWDLMAHFTDNVAMLMPFLHSSDTRFVTKLKGNTGLLSGVGWTPEMGTVLAIASTLDSLDAFGFSDYVERWFQGKWIIAEQSDDNLYTMDNQKDYDRWVALTDDITAYVQENHGFVVKLDHGNVFLKRIIPNGARTIFDTSPVMFRTIQNYFGNEEKKVGRFAPLVTRYGFLARCIGINNHPFAKSLVPKLKELYSLNSCVKDLLPYMGKQATEFPHTLLQEMMEFGASAEGQLWLQEMIRRSTFDPVASLAVSFFAGESNLYDKLILERIKKRENFYKSLHPSSPLRKGVSYGTLKNVIDERIYGLLR
jgi:hypothetical protein